MRPTGTLRSEAGFTYTAVMVIVVIMGIMLAQAATVWKTAMQREREAELLFRGMQVRNALQRFYYGRVVTSKAENPKDDPKKKINELKDLTRDPTMLETRRYLREFALKDPMTGKEWALIKDGQRIIGVSTTLEAEPIKKGNFPPELNASDFENKAKYSEWAFIYNRFAEPKGATGGAKNLDTKRPDELNNTSQKDRRRHPPTD